MKERRKSGATHSFRLTRKASEIVDNINHPRGQGGKSRKISLAIEWYFSPRGDMPSYDELLISIENLQRIITVIGTEQDLRAKNVESERLPPTWRDRIFRFPKLILQRCFKTGRNR